MAAIDLCGTADVWAYLQKPVTETNGTAVAADLITRASRLIHKHCSREFIPGAFGTAPGTVVDRRSFWYYGQEVQRFSPFDLRSAGTVELITHPAGTTALTENVDFFFEPLPASEGVYERMRFVYHGHCYQQQELRVNGSWGFPSVPEDVKDAAVKTVAIWLRRDVHAFSQSFNIDEGRVERPEALPSAVKAELTGYRRTGIS